MDPFALKTTVPRLAWVGAFAAAGLAAGGVGDAVWSITAGFAGVLAGAIFGIAHRIAGDGFRTWAAETGFAALAGGAVGFVAWLSGLSDWLALEIALGGRVGRATEAVAGAVVGALAGWVACGFARRQPGVWRERCRRAVLGIAALAAAVLVGMFILFTGPRDLDRYPPASISPYRLPWTAGVTRLCIQGNRAIVSHRDREEFAYDFAMPVGSDVCAARGGTVLRMDVTHDGNGLHANNNFVIVDHGDGTLGWYLHLRQGGSLVKPGQYVRQGEPIAESGNVGLSLLPHLHFQVTDTHYQLLRVTFADVNSDDGVPRMFKRYVSGNAAP